MGAEVILANFLIVSMVYIVGFGLLILGTVLFIRAYGAGTSVKVDAVIERTEKGTSVNGLLPGNRTYYLNTVKPFFRYWYNGKEYLGAPMLVSNTFVKNIKPGVKCQIRINPMRPERVYSPFRWVVSLMMWIFGLVYILGVSLLA